MENKFAVEKTKTGIKINFHDPVRGLDSYIILNRANEQIRLFFDLDDPKYPGHFGGGDCDLIITKEIAKKLSLIILDLVELAKSNIMEEGNVKSIRFNTSDKNNEEYPNGVPGNIICIACLGSIEFIIHFDDPKEDTDYTFSVDLNTAIAIADNLS